MITSSGKKSSLWMQTAPLPSLTPLPHDVQVDVCVVGAGIAGLSVAYNLMKEGKIVLVIDDGDVGSGETGRTTAHLASALDDRFYELERLHGREGARLAYESHAAAIDWIEKIVREEKIACDFTRLDGYLFNPLKGSDSILDREYEAAHRAGFHDVVRLPRVPLHSFDSGSCLRFPRQGQFHVLKYLRSLIHLLLNGGAKIHTQTHASHIEGGDPGRIQTAHGPAIMADAVIVATNVPVNDRVAIHTKQAPYRTYVVGGAVRHGAVPKALYWDTEDPYHYVRLQKEEGQTGRDILIVGGEDHETGHESDPEKRFALLEEWTRERFPVQTFPYRWSGQVLEPHDALAYIGRNPMDKPNVFIATGDSGNGMTHGTIAGLLLTDLIMGRKNPWASLYDPSRKSIKAAYHYVEENLTMLSGYGRWMTGGDVKDTDEIRPGSGALIRKGFHQVAAYRDETGKLHEFSAVCPHLGGVLCWNSSENTWDCPVHGSRFDACGHVVNGPAIGNLKPIHGEDESFEDPAFHHEPPQVP